MPPVLSPLLALTGLSILAHLSSLSFVPRVCGGSCPASPFTHTSLAFSLPSLACYSSPPRTFLPFCEHDLASDPQSGDPLPLSDNDDDGNEGLDCFHVLTHPSVRLCSPGGKCIPLVPHHLRSPTMAAASQATLYDPPAPALSPAPLCAPCDDNDMTRHGNDVMVMTWQRCDNDNDTATTTTPQQQQQ